MNIEENDTPKVLIIDDKKENLQVLIDILEKLEADIFVATNGRDALQRVKKHSFDLILLDIVMPAMDGYEVCRILKRNEKTKDIPLVFISSLCGIEEKLKAFSHGGDDYITKPFLLEELVARIKLHLHKSLMLKSLKHLLRRSYHELYNPLAIISSSVQMQNLKYGSSKYTEAITVAYRTLQLVYDDLYYSIGSRKQNNETASIDLNSYLKARIEFFSHLADVKNIVIDFKSEVDAYINIKEKDLARIVDNTLSNAVKYANENTKVTIKLTKQGQETVFSCNNFGSSIKNLNRIFESNFRENYEKIGMGIGLEIVSAICKKNSIKPNVVSIEGDTTFSYRFAGKI